MLQAWLLQLPMPDQEVICWQTSVIPKANRLQHFHRKPHWTDCNPSCCLGKQVGKLGKSQRKIISLSSRIYCQMKLELPFLKILLLKYQGLSERFKSRKLRARKGPNDLGRGTEPNHGYMLLRRAPHPAQFQGNRLGIHLCIGSIQLKLQVQVRRNHRTHPALPLLRSGRAQPPAGPFS